MPAIAEQVCRQTLPQVVPSRTVVNCYEFLDRTLNECGFLDMTEGMYLGNPETPYAEAQRNQINWLLDQVHCGRGSRVLDIGCGHGTLLEAARERGATATGITISPAQVSRCCARGLDVRLFDYRNIGDQWQGQFDAIVANGSIEHFAQPQDFLDGRDDKIYKQLFALCHRLLDPHSPSRRFATTVIHRHGTSPMPQPRDLLKGPLAFRWGSPEFHWALLQHSFGGFYPELGQLQRCADPYFELVTEVDGTEDYRLTSETWFRQVKRAFFRWSTARRLWPRLASFLLRHPRHGAVLVTCLFLAESWQRQFRGPHPPTRLLRQTWGFVPR